MHNFLLAFSIAFSIAIAAYGALAQSGSGDAPAVDEDLLQQGQELFRSNCTICHQTDGAGNPPTFPALAGNDSLENVELIVTNIHEGRNAMPAFPQFDATQVAALATYVRNAWDNDFGGVSLETVEMHLSGEEAEAATEFRSIWDGIYTVAQAERGEPMYRSNCSECHGFAWLSESYSDTPLAGMEPTGEGPVLMLVTGDPPVAPRLTGASFISRWDGQTVGTLYQYASTSMPQNNPASLTDQEYVDIIGFMFAATNVPAGEDELAPDLQILNRLLIEVEPEED